MRSGSDGPKHFCGQSAARVFRKADAARRLTACGKPIHITGILRELQDLGCEALLFVFTNYRLESCYSGETNAGGHRDEMDRKIEAEVMVCSHAGRRRYAVGAAGRNRTEP